MLPYQFLNQLLYWAKLLEIFIFQNFESLAIFDISPLVSSLPLHNIYLID